MTRRRRLAAWTIHIGTGLPLIAILVASLDFWATVAACSALLLATVGSGFATNIWDGTTRRDLRIARAEAEDCAAELLLRNAALERDIQVLGERLAVQHLAQLDAAEEKLIEERVAVLFAGGYSSDAP